MAAALSDTEFHRMQLQLIELRTKNYELEGKTKQQDRELSLGLEKIDFLNKELAKAKQAISKSKKAKDVEVLMQESDSLQHKLQSQEEEFRLQNQTLMNELSLLVANNEELKKEVEDAKAGSESSSGTTEKNGDHEDELRRLHAENSALQKNLNALQERLDSESRKGQGNSPTFVEEDSMIDGDLGTDEIDGPQEEIVKESSSSEEPGDILNSSALRLQLDTELEEKKLLKQQLDTITKENKETITNLQDEIEKLSDKFKKKQESFLQLHAEKETAIKESSAKLEESQAARDRDQKYYKDQISKLQTELDKARQEQEQQQLLSKKGMAGLEAKIAELQAQVSTSSVVNNHQLKEQSDKFRAEIAANKESLARLTKERDDLTTQLRESQHAAEVATTQLHETLVEKDKQIATMQEISKVAEKRKLLLDEMAIKYQKEFDSHREDVSGLENKHTEEVEKLETIISEQKKKVSELSKNVPLMEEIQGKMRSLEDAKGWLERRLAEVEEDLSKTKTSHQEEKENSESEHASKVESLTVKHAEEVENLVTKNSKLKEEWDEQDKNYKAEIEDLKNAANNLKQEIKDSQSEKKIHEKKGMTMLKDLKRQLHAERRRAEKLQIKLQEVLTDNQGKGVEELFKSSESNDFLSGDTSSVSSWGAGASGLGKDSIASGPQSPMSVNNSFVSETSLGDEYNDLLKRVANMQQDKWALEEKVQHLETSNACMAEDLLNKTSIIEHYVMESRSGRRQSAPSDEKLSLKKVRDLINKPGEQTLQTQDMNRKLQSMLEESLTKNMHLQQDLELMSQEVVRLSKLSAMAAMPVSDPTVKPPTELALSSTNTGATETTTTTTTTTPTIVIKSEEELEPPTTTDSITSPTDQNHSEGNFEMISSSELDLKSPMSASDQDVESCQDEVNTQVSGENRGVETTPS